MILISRDNECGFTGLEVVIILVISICITAFLLIYLGGGGMPDWSRTFPGGLVAESMYISGDNLQPVGSLYGFSSVNRQLGNTVLSFPCQDPGRLGAVRLLVSLFIGDTGSIDMDKVRVVWNGPGGGEELFRTQDTDLICPNWTISHKFNLLPGRTADADDWLEPQEQFELTACPSAGILPYGTLAITISPDGVAMPLVITRTVPPRIEPVMNLG